MDHVFDYSEAKAYAEWLKKPGTQAQIALEHQLMLSLLQPFRGESVLDIGCGTGAGLLPFSNIGVQTTGLDPSPYMLDLALENLANRANLYRGYAQDLPFEDNSFNYACLNTTLEFVDDPDQALREACRVAKDRIFIGVLNRYALKGIQRRIQGIFAPSFFNHARFFSIWEIKSMLRNILGKVPIEWRTVCQLPATSVKLVTRFESSSLVQRSPTGAFVGIAAYLVPRFRTRPLAIRYTIEQSARMVIQSG